jgi:hypothetical protein
MFSLPQKVPLCPNALGTYWLLWPCVSCLHSQLFIFLNYCCTGGYNVTFTKVLAIYHSWIHPLYHSPVNSPPAIPGIVATGLIFPFTCMYTWYFHHVHLLQAFFVSSPLWLYQPPRQNLLCLPAIRFCKKKWHFCLRQLYRVFPCDISIYIYIYIYICICVYVYVYMYI